MTLDIHGLMRELSETRPIFHSEADFQHALAWQIHEAMPDSQIRLEYPFRHDGNTMNLDIWLPTERMAIELKYLAKRLELNFKAERFAMNNHGASDQRRYDFLLDVQRLEYIANYEDESARAGFAVLLTNDPAYWKSPTIGWESTIDADFRLHEGRKVMGPLMWAAHAGAGSIKGREEPIDIIGSYDLNWRDYSRLGESNNQQFRYLAVMVQ